MDTDGNGSLSRDEYMAAKSKRGGHRAERMFRRHDANADGTITLGEGADRATKWFKRLDADGDGRVTKGELDAARKAHRSGRRGRHGKDG
jgi:Ca2+-binding EF-hand superfamily protein